jgi:hypothetical protein
MLTKKALAALAASALLTTATAAPAFAEDIPDMQKENIEGSGPDVDAGASKGKDASIPDQEKANIDGAGPNTDAGASTGASTGTSDGDQSIPGGNRENLE